MNLLMMLTIPLIAVVLLAMPLVPVYKGITTGKQAKSRLIFNICAFFGMAIVMTILPIGNFLAYADTAAAVAGEITTGAGLAYLAAALVTGMSCLGAGYAVACAAPAAIGAFSEDASAFGKAIIFVVLGEGVAIYGLLISILIINKL